MEADNSGDAKQGADGVPAEGQGIIGGLPSALDTVNSLMDHKFSVCWAMFRLNINPEPSYLADRRWKCIFVCGEVKGVCEGPSTEKAFHGALIYFLGLLRQKYEWVMNAVNWTCEWNATFLYGSPVWEILMTRLEAKGIQAHHEIKESLDKFRNGKVYTCALTIGSKMFMGKSASSAEFARLFAAEIAFQEMFQEPCPKLKVYMGTEAKTPLNLYFMMNQDDLYRQIDDNQDEDESSSEDELAPAS